MLIYQRRVFPEDLQMNPSVHYFFADNDNRSGHWQFRQNDNFIGIRVKKDEHAFDNSYWSDSTYDMNILKVKHDFKIINSLLKELAPVVYSNETFNINASEYFKMSPKTWSYIEKYIEHIKKKWG
tara:strand:+ start:867 stop:1241 length:375 start_codon:yes stop_codon:yes gene_type:complete